MNRLTQNPFPLDGSLVGIAQHAMYTVYHAVTRLNYEHELYAVRKRVSDGTFKSFDPLPLHVYDFRIKTPSFDAALEGYTIIDITSSV